MGLKTFFENIRHVLTPAGVAENLRHEVALMTINLSHHAAGFRENDHHMHNVGGEIFRHGAAFHDVPEGFRHGISVIGEELRHNICSEFIDIIH